ncbi:MAG: Wzz/FepE/Etk N-terminal domain-containing protein [Candidatus Marinimicrobia bacterium]|nr:Wzz/FepE/Etk N-terminal domain-containing protein [Candidatus Neomarinimicrobiota bacterium]MCK9559071.1 Wzz/FepE/Etk N-terminal domain-containing protein [Candidatus Neomarinimicrobiota bacterium]
MQQIKKEHPLLYFVLKHRIVNIISLFLGAILVFSLVFFVMKKKYTASVTILPPSQDLSSGIMGSMGALASIAGLDLPQSTLQSPEMYKEILTSRKVLDTILFEEFEGVDTSGMIFTELLINILDIEARNEKEKIDKALKKLSNDVIYIDINSESKVIKLSVTLTNPVYAANVANRMVELLNYIVINQIQYENRQQLLYIEDHIRYSQDSIKIAEKNLQTFLETIKSIAEPVNQIKELALKRDLELYTAIWIELKQQKEIYTLKSITSLAEVKVLDKAQPPYLKSRPKRLLMMISLGGLYFILQICMNGIILIFINIRKEFKPNVPIPNP